MALSLNVRDIFKTQNSISVFDGIYNPGNKYVGISLNQKDASISNLKIISYDETKLWNGSDKSSALLGEGTQDNPYLISSANDLAYMANQVNSEDRSLSSYYKSYYRLTKDISLNGQNWGGIGVSLSSNIRAFEGDFDGNNHRISGIHTDGTSGTALFNYVGNANIHDLKVCGVFSGGSTYTAALVAHIIHPVSAEADEPLNCHISNDKSTATINLNKEIAFRNNVDKHRHIGLKHYPPKSKIPFRWVMLLKKHPYAAHAFIGAVFLMGTLFQKTLLPPI